MGSTGRLKIWPEYRNTKDCTLGYCSLYCPQRCYIIIPSPPPFKHFPHESSSTTILSPLMITIIIAILATAFLFAVYYTIISKYCGKRFATTRAGSTQAPDMELGGLTEPSHEPWFVSKNGLDEVLIKSIAAFKYKKGEGLVQGSDCSVCLSEFVEDESLKLLPKCSHAFHLQCIDAWLQCHSNCPLCRANVALTTTSSALLSLPLDEPPSQSQDEVAEITANLEIVVRDQESEGINVAKAPSISVEIIAINQIGNDQEGYDEHMRRSLPINGRNE